MVNLSPCSWRLTFTGSAPASPARTIEVASRAAARITLPADNYTITQTAENLLPPAAASRRFTATFAPGESYRWPLATLLTGAAESAP